MIARTILTVIQEGDAIVVDAPCRHPDVVRNTSRTPLGNDMDAAICEAVRRALTALEAARDAYDPTIAPLQVWDEPDAEAPRGKQ